MNSFLGLQSRVRDLLRAHPFFSDFPADGILIEDITDLDSIVAQQVNSATGFVVVVTTARGDQPLDMRGKLRLTETLTVSLMRSTIATGGSLLDGLQAAMQAIHSQPVDAAATGVMSRMNELVVIGHEYVTPPEGATFAVHQLHVSAPLFPL